MPHPNVHHVHGVNIIHFPTVLAHCNHIETACKGSPSEKNSPQEFFLKKSPVANKRENLTIDKHWAYEILQPRLPAENGGKSAGENGPIVTNPRSARESR